MRSAVGDYSRRLCAPLTLTLVLVSSLLVIAAPAAVDASTRGVYPAVGVAAFLVLALTIVVIWSLKSFRVQVTAKIAWLAGIITVALTLGPILLWYLGRDGLGYQISQALGVGGTPYGFGDMDVVLSWLNCPREGIDPYSAQASSCAVGPSNYGPAIFWLSPTGLGRSAAPILGVVGAVLSAIAIVWLARQSKGAGRIALVIASASAAWILMQERANLDAAIVWCAVLLVWLVRSRSGLWPWILATVPIWILGAWKYYPFAMVLALLPVLRLRYGWTVLTGFVALALGYLVLMREYVALSLTSNSNLSGGEFWGIGRDVAAAFIAGEAEVVSGWGWADALLGVIVLAAFVWGWSIVPFRHVKLWKSYRPLRAVPLTAESMLAISGASATLVSIGLSGFGYHYKAALLVLAVPLLARFTMNPRQSVFRAGLFMLVLVVISVFVTSNLFLTSVSTLVVAGFSTGAALRTLVAWLPLGFARQSRGRKNSTASAPATR